MARNPRRHVLRTWLGKYKRRGLRYWLGTIRYWVTVAAVIWLGMYLGAKLDEHQFGLTERYKIYRLMQKLSPRDPYTRTVVVLIGDEEYWKGELGGRVPIRRDYLARIISALDKADAAVIAVDFDFRAQTPDGSILENSIYEKETDVFLATVKEVARRRAIILPKTVRCDSNGDCWSEADIYDRDPEINGGAKGVFKGYISLPYDYREVPLGLYLTDNSRISSFPEAIVTAYDPERKALAHLNDEDSVTYSGYVPREKFARISVQELLTADPLNLQQRVGHRIVVIGGEWSRDAYHRGPLNDLHETPVGPLVGVFMHANWVEALLDLRTFTPVSDLTRKVIEIFVALFIAITFALDVRYLFKAAIIFVLIVFLFITAYFSWQLFGFFFDFFMPALLVSGHAVFEQVRHWRNLAIKCERHHLV